jgi:hypothetical protein
MVPQGRRPLTPELGGGVGRLRAWPSAVRIEGKKKRMGAQETSEKKMGGGAVGSVVPHGEKESVGPSGRRAGGGGGWRSARRGSAREGRGRRQGV